MKCYRPVRRNLQAAGVSAGHRQIGARLDVAHFEANRCRRLSDSFIAGVCDGAPIDTALDRAVATVENQDGDILCTLLHVADRIDCDCGVSQLENLRDQLFYQDRLGTN